jgi:hypothetical protein
MLVPREPEGKNKKNKKTKTKQNFAQDSPKSL